MLDAAALSDIYSRSATLCDRPAVQGKYRFFASPALALQLASSPRDRAGAYYQPSPSLDWQQERSWFSDLGSPQGGGGRPKKASTHAIIAGPQGCRPFRVNPDCQLGQRSAGAAPARTALTISEDPANCNRNLRLSRKNLLCGTQALACYR